MDALEAQYRKTPKNPITLRAYIQMLIEKGHIIESKFYFDSLYSLDPNSLKTNQLGIQIASLLFEKNIRRYEDGLRIAKANHEQIYSLHCFYYLSFANVAFDQLKEATEAMLDYEPTCDFTIQVVFSAVLRIKCPNLTYKFVKKYLSKCRIDNKSQRELKKIFEQRLGDVLKKRLEYLRR